MIHLIARRTSDVGYLTDDGAQELTGVRDGGPGWWLRGTGDAASSADVAAVLLTSARSRTTGYDIVIAAPRPLSILVAIDVEAAPAVVEAHRAGVTAAVDYLEDRALVVRQRVEDGEYLRTARWSRVVGYTHGINRAGEPHLHDHVLVGAKPERETTVADSRSLFAHVATADALYRSTLRLEVNRRTSYTTWRSFSGTEGVTGLDEGYRALWGGHLDERGSKVAWSRDEVLRRWNNDRERFEEIGVLREPPRVEFDAHRYRASFEGATRITRRDLVRAFADASTFGVATPEVDAAIDRLHPNLRLTRGLDERPILLNRARRLEPGLDQRRFPDLALRIDEDYGLDRSRPSRTR